MKGLITAIVINERSIMGKEHDGSLPWETPKIKMILDIFGGRPVKVTKYVDTHRDTNNEQIER